MTEEKALELPQGGDRNPFVPSLKLHSHVDDMFRFKESCFSYLQHTPCVEEIGRANLSCKLLTYSGPFANKKRSLHRPFSRKQKDRRFAQFIKGGAHSAFQMIEHNGAPSASLTSNVGQQLPGRSIKFDARPQAIIGLKECKGGEN